MKSNEVLVKPLVFPGIGHCSHGYSGLQVWEVCASLRVCSDRPPNQQQRWVSPKLELGCSTVLQETGKVKAGLGTRIPTGITAVLMRQGWMSGPWSWAGSGLPCSLMSDV